MYNAQSSYIHNLNNILLRNIKELNGILKLEFYERNGYMSFFNKLGSALDIIDTVTKKDSNKSPKETGGPVVRTGPTAGQNRSRNQDGTWRRKRSDADKPRK